ncbi:hypothetical protein [Actinomadura rupiterrae]|uniref:hypothetical protein n=1 Tax=Actinomadura rupiterrae TaxID=559627 RepID=UPI0020A4D314|nr:hypothetical protein [Actinomadura rupiterrae]MCP2342264.1 hypothetical protein [Actinomadura rupiterrae]
MLRRTTTAAATVALTASLAAACPGSQCTATRIANAYEVYSPFVLAVLPELAPETIPGIAVDLGLFAADSLAKYVIDHKVKPGKTWLLIEQTLGGRQQTSVFELSTDRDLKVSVNGAQLDHVDLYVRQRQIKVVVPAGTGAKVAVTDAAGGDSVAVRGTVPKDLGGSQDLETGKTFHHSLFKDDAPESSAADVRYTKYVTGDPELINGTVAARYSGSDQPTLGACMSTPSAAWSGKLQGWPGDKNSAWCVKTGAGHYGLAVHKSKNGIFFGSTKDMDGLGYLLWAQPGLPAAVVPQAKIKKC